ncbi:DUF4333 domain-containing protein [Amycolatopsis sp.]|uniref:DUF4333 domain-containing protein n=1 Tax=Amycolatopsis sp. TaxID=37632 RepID=UPI002BA85ACC|nr:DUF4333 domain-containing protein [Amycolatopsis sp.]HVV13771.1 DUF4333 domain-containing protein [Amycolatopsis sp.]
MYRKLFAASALAVLTLTGCSVHAEVFTSADMIAKTEYERGISDALASAVGARPASVECPGAVKAAVGQTTRCVLTASDGSRYGLTSVITKVEGKKWNAHIEVDRQPIS